MAELPLPSHVQDCMMVTGTANVVPRQFPFGQEVRNPIQEPLGIYPSNTLRRPAYLRYRFLYPRTVIPLEYEFLHSSVPPCFAISKWREIDEEIVPVGEKQQIP